MKNQPFYFFILLFLYNLNGLHVKAQINNPCGVTAKIFPGAADSVVPVNTSVNFISAGNNATSLEWLYDGMKSGITGPMWNYVVSTGVHTISLVAYNANCSDTTTVVYFSAGTPHDVDSLLVANYGLVDTHEYGVCLDATPDGGFILGGYGADLNCGEKGLLVKLRDKGCIDWSKKIKGFYNCDAVKVTSVYASIDTSYYVSGNGGYRFLMKLDKTGNVVWNKKWEVQGLPGTFINHNAFTEDQNGNIYTITGSPINLGWLVNKIDPSGNIIWSKLYELSYYDPYIGAGLDFVTPTDLVWLNGKIFVIGNVYTSTSRFFNFVTRLDASSGQTDWNYDYTNPGVNSVMGFDQVSLYDTTLMVTGGGAGQYITLIDQQGSVKKVIQAQFSSSYSPQFTRAEADSNGHIYLMQWTKETLPLQPYFAYYTNFAKIDTSLNKYWGMVYANYSRGYFLDAALSKENVFAALGTDFGYVSDGVIASRDFRFIKIDTPAVSSDLNCNYNTLAYSLSVHSIARNSFQWFTDSALKLSPVQVNDVTIGDAYMQSRYSCPDLIDSCSFMTLSGPVNLCSLSGIYTYRMHRNKKCVLIPQWQVPAGVTIVSQTDSSLSVKFSGFGSYNISASLNSCIPIKDSLSIVIASKGHLLDLGPDTTICSGNKIRLHAGNNFFSYLWNDGTVDSVLDVTQAGTYWVETIDSCSNHIRDSITVSMFVNTINIGPDRISCANDTLHLDAPAGFISYQWSNDYNLSSTSMQNVIVSPAKDTAYYIKAEKFPNCFAYDTLKVKIKSAPAIQLGTDTSLCQGNNIILDAGSGFAQYLWSDGTAAQKATFYSKGNYSVIGTAVNGCKSYDTLSIENIFSNPVPVLDHSPGLCAGTTRTLQPGIWSTYLWQDGSSLPTFTIKDIGAYKVSVTDNHLCIGKDSVQITQILPAASAFLPADTSICSYGEIILKTAQTYSSYLWSNGQTSPSVSIMQPGLYWLQVIASNSCSGRDSILVSLKQCLSGFFMPNAFTPNGDNLNDVIKPMIFGNLVMFNFKIYNRFGQMVFTSNNFAKGWDGAFKEVQQNAGVYVWICHYQLSGEPEKTKSGQFSLLR